MQYIQARIEFSTKKRFYEQLTQFLQGFWYVIPKEILKVFEADELEVALCGSPWINLKDWEKNTEYKGDY